MDVETIHRRWCKFKMACWDVLVDPMLTRVHTLQLHSYVLPLIQGFFQVASFPVPREPESTEEGDAAQVDYIIMSRRSRDRAGLRYQRRGVDDDAHVANFVETETVMRLDVSPQILDKSIMRWLTPSQREGVSNVFSYVQIRGSSASHTVRTENSIEGADVPTSSTLLDTVRLQSETSATGGT